MVHDIVSSGFGPGDKLAGEAEMLEHYGVSRESLREALRLLESQGLISIKRGPGGGPVVGSSSPMNLGRTLALYLHFARVTYAELFTAWEMAEPLLAELAARRPDRATLRTELASWIGGIDPTGDDFARISTAFHETVNRLAANRVLSLVVPAFTCIITDHVLATFDTRVLHDEISHDHQRVARAIALGRPSAARRLMEAHVHQVAEFYRSHFSDEMGELVLWR